MARSKIDLSLPSHVSALGIQFQVQVVEKVDDEASAGETLSDHRIIKVASSQDTRRRWTTLLHEYMHAVLYVNGVSSALNDEGTEEIIVQSLEHALEQFLLSNGDKLIAALAAQQSDV